MSAYNRSSNRTSGNPWHTNRPVQKTVPENNLNKSEIKFKEAQKKLQAAVKKYAKDYDSSSDEGELETNHIIGSILKNYKETGCNLNNLSRTQVILQDTFTSGANTCLICISSVKRTDSIWNCNECHCSFHLTCIQRWSKDTITQQKQALEEQIVVRHNLNIAWGCPKCRQEYGPDDVPTKYFCFCKKTVDPPFESFLVPHSCGEICNKKLKPLCCHACVLLCHPGPCPPCPKTVMVCCYCGSQPPRIQRCSNQEWSCSSPCNRPLACQKHQCAQPCHAGDCPPCPKKSIQKCICGSTSKLRDCTTPIWQCDKVCSKLLECGHHNCLEVCHIGKCDPCILSKPRTCPCGKSSYNLPCTEDTPTCGDTCGKLLECGIHVCHQRCHKEKCGPCLETITKACRCGAHSKEVHCWKPYLCESKCKQIKDCNKHPCNRKCCDGNCPPCEKPCGRTLSCSNHKCNSICHRGPCYPCNLTETVPCRCGQTVITVPCGRKHKTRPPKCSKPCNIPPDCHHEKRDAHRCHFGDCPPCRQICNKERTTCPHICPAPCHSAVLVRVEGQKPSMPWEQTEPQIQQKALPCPDCILPVPVTCLGKHETSDWPCHTARVSSCGRKCGRLLSCGNHNCLLLCHAVEGAIDEFKAGTNCQACDSGCTKPRPEGCQHSCLKPCHPGACPPCKQMLRIRCHCGLNQPYVACSSWTLTEDKEELQSCGDQCPKNYDCGHRCRSNCHSGPCPDSEQCRKKVKVFCDCKRIKKEFSCSAVRTKTAIVGCDETCLQKQEEEKKLKQLEDEQRKKEEELKNQKELEKYEKKFQGKKRTKERRTISQVDEQSLLQKYGLIGFSILMAFVAVYFYCLVL